MKIVLCAIDAKYIHPNVALRLIRANCPLPCDLLEFTIRIDPDAIVEAVLAKGPDLVGFSVYLWNRAIVARVVAGLKRRSAALLVAGGPEVAYDVEGAMATMALDAVVTGEGEETFAALARAVADGAPWRSLPGLAYRDDDGLCRNPGLPIADLATLASPHRFPEDDPDRGRRIQYLELARGCPFGCTYCSAPLEGGVRRFPLEAVERDILHLLERGGRTFKFLDRTFNADPVRARRLFAFLIANRRPETVFQFEIAGDRLPASLVAYLNAEAPPGYFRFEIGVQTTNEASLRAVARRQDNARLFDTVRALVAGGRIVVHLDLIAGLPEEDFASFAKSFDETFALGAPELQLGILKLLPGTPLRDQAERFGYACDPEPPYAVSGSAWMSEAELAVIRGVAEIVERFHNRGSMRSAFAAVAAVVPSMFAFLASFRTYLADTRYPFANPQPIDGFRAFDAFVRQTLGEFGLPARETLLTDYLAHAGKRPQPWWPEPDPASRRVLLRQAFGRHPKVSLDDWFRYGFIASCEDRRFAAAYLPSGTVVVRL